EIDFNKLHHLPLLNKKENIQRLLDFFKTRCSFFEGYQIKIAAALQLLGDIKDDSLSACHTVFPILEAVENIKNDLYTEPQNGEIVEMWSLSPIYYFLKGYKRVEHRESDIAYLEQSIRLYKTYFQDIKPLVEDIIERFKETIALLNLPWF
ncbi:MAG TPA: hypothetical protein VK186_24190, partial [Candidatus Deferrimicrobium sp.]|nr:hypothetical protein [Candidatus Deferrimicrobium sp.]